MKNKDNDKVVRFSLPARLAHWLYVVPFIILLITGCALVFHSFQVLIGNDGLKLFMKIHHFWGMFITFVPLVLILVFGGKNFISWIKHITHFSKNDIKFVASFPKSFFSGKYRHDIPQGKYNGGEKINSLIQVFGFLMMVITGWIMLFPENFTADTLGTVRALHGFFALVLGGIMLGHAYLGIIHPDSRESIKGMTTGKVSRKFAKQHHGEWLEEIDNKDFDSNNKGGIA